MALVVVAVVAAAGVEGRLAGVLRWPWLRPCCRRGQQRRIVMLHLASQSLANIAAKAWQMWLRPLQTAELKTADVDVFDAWLSVASQQQRSELFVRAHRHSRKTSRRESYHGHHGRTPKSLVEPQWIFQTNFFFALGEHFGHLRYTSRAHRPPPPGSLQGALALSIRSRSLSLRSVSSRRVRRAGQREHSATRWKSYFFFPEFAKKKLRVSGSLAAVVRSRRGRPGCQGIDASLSLNSRAYVFAAWGGA